MVGKSPTRRTARKQLKAEKKAKKKDNKERKEEAASAAKDDVPTEENTASRLHQPAGIRSCLHRTFL